MTMPRSTLPRHAPTAELEFAFEQVIRVGALASYLAVASAAFTAAWLTQNWRAMVVGLTPALNEARTALT